MVKPVEGSICVDCILFDNGNCEQYRNHQHGEAKPIPVKSCSLFTRETKTRHDPEDAPPEKLAVALPNMAVEETK